MTGSRLKRATNRRSIQSFHRQAQRPLAAQGPRAATADPSAVPMRLKKRFCARNGIPGRPTIARLRLRVSAGPSRTAYTPDLGLG